ncbi:MAG: hypothetical protein BWY52_02135 [Chloroflexi bacterium ADurb.Bin325]|nr:MAG: hypothetical protein BWY52_02135 [Chloroflexi bacterium ADurb.Bin325]
MTEQNANTVQIQCPNCGTQYAVPVRTMIDVSADPRLRQQFLANQINVAVCPNCQTGGLLEVPLVYHDAGAEFFAVYFPQQLNISEMEKQKMIGDLTQSIMRQLPPDQRKGYFLSPRQFVNRRNLMDAVLGTMGFTQEELDRQRKKAKMVEQFMVMADDPKGLQMMLKGNDAQIDAEFFSILATMLQQAEATGDTKTAERLTLLREGLMPITAFGKRLQKQRAAVEGLRDLKDPDEFLARVIAGDEDEVAALTFAARPLMDYAFFQKLSERVDASEGAEKTRLAQLRDHLLETTQQLDRVAREAMEEGAKLLQELVDSPSPRSATQEHMAEIDEAFMNLLAANMQKARQDKDEALFDRLMMIYDEVMDMIQESLPSEVQFVDALLNEEYPDGTRAMLQENRASVTPEVLDLMEQMSKDLAQRDDDGAKETAKRLRDIRTQALLLA